MKGMKPEIRLRQYRKDINLFIPFIPVNNDVGFSLSLRGKLILS